MAIASMPIIERLSEAYNRVLQEGFHWFIVRSGRALREWLWPPWVCLYWYPVSESSDVRSQRISRAGGDKFHGLLTRLLNGVELRVVNNLDELKPEEYCALKDSIGGSDIPVYHERLSQGLELHILFIDRKVAGTLSFVFGRTHRFQHVVLTDRDAMALDGRVDPKYRGRGLYPIFLSLALEKLKEKGIERLYIDTNETNEEANRSFVSVGFEFLLKFRATRGRYRFDRHAV